MGLMNMEITMSTLFTKVTFASQTWRRRRNTVKELSALSDRLLEDIGIHRSQIRSVVEELLQGTERQTIRPEPDVEAQAPAADVRTPFAYDREHKAAA